MAPLFSPGNDPADRPRFLGRHRDPDDGLFRRRRQRRDDPPAPTPDSYQPTPPPYAPQAAYTPVQPYPGQVALQPGWPGPPPQAAPAAWPGQYPQATPTAGPPGLPLSHPGVPIPSIPGPLGIDVHKVVSSIVGFLVRAWAKIADVLGLRRATPAQVAEAQAKTAAVMARFDPYRTGYLDAAALAAWVGPDQVQANLAYGDRDRDGRLSGAEVQRAFERRAVADTPLASVNIALPDWLAAGARGRASLFQGPRLAPGQAPTITAEISLGPDVLQQIHAEAYQQARQAIQARKAPDLGVPDVAKRVLSRLAAGNVSGQAAGAVAINLNNPALVEAVRSAVTQAVVDTPFLRHTLRPQGMQRLRSALINADAVQGVIVKQVQTQVGQVQRQVETLSNGVVVFHAAPVGQTGARVCYRGDGFVANVDGQVPDIGRFFPPRQ